MPMGLLAQPAERGGVSAETTTGAPELLVANLASIQDILRRVAARQRLSPIDEERFSSYALQRIAEDDCAILRRFQGRSSLRTYLVVVIYRLLLDYRDRESGNGTLQDMQSA